MTSDRDQLRDELLAATAARRELSSDEERYLVEQFLDRLDRDIDARIAARSGAMPVARPRAHPAAIVPIALGIAIPLSAIAGAAAGLPGIALTWVAIVLIVYLTTR